MNNAERTDVDTITVDEKFLLMLENHNGLWSDNQGRVWRFRGTRKGPRYGDYLAFLSNLHHDLHYVEWTMQNGEDDPPLGCVLELHEITLSRETIEYRAGNRWYAFPSKMRIKTEEGGWSYTQ